MSPSCYRMISSYLKIPENYNYYYYLLLWEFFTPALADTFSLEFEGQQVSRILPCVLADLNNAVIGMVSSCPVISEPFSLCTNPLADQRVKVKESEKKKRPVPRPCKRIENPIEDKSDSDTNCNWRALISHQRIDTGTGGLGNKRTSGDYPNYNIIEIN